MRCRCGLVSLLILGWATSSFAADPIAWLPADVNAVARINVAELYKTPLAKKEGWLAKSMESFIHQDAFIPPGTTQIVIGAELDLSDTLAANRKYAVIVPEGHLTVDKLSDWLPGGVETISDRPAAPFGAGGYVLDCGDGCWLATTVSSRQSLSRWYREGAAASTWRIPRYLHRALRAKENTAQFVMAIDLQDNFSEARIRAELKDTDWIKSDAAMQNVAKTLEGVLGITFSINIDQDRTGTILVDFEKNTAVLKPILDKLVLAIRQRVGANSDEFDSWKWDVKGTQVIGTGLVSPGGGRKLLSILEPPSITHAISASAQATSEVTPEQKMGKTTLKYFKSIRVLLDDLQVTLKKSIDNHALYMERYARKIEELPRLNVDPILLDYAEKVSSSLRYQGQTQRMSLIKAGTENLQTWNSGSTWVGPYGWSAYRPNPGTANVIDAQANQEEKSVRFAEWKQIEEGLTVVRRKMTDKYQIEF